MRYCSCVCVVRAAWLTGLSVSRTVSLTGQQELVHDLGQPSLCLAVAVTRRRRRMSESSAARVTMAGRVSRTPDWHLFAETGPVGAAWRPPRAPPCWLVKWSPAWWCCCGVDGCDEQRSSSSATDSSSRTFRRLLHFFSSWTTRRLRSRGRGLATIKSQSTAKVARWESPPFEPWKWSPGPCLAPCLAPAFYVSIVE